MNDEDEPFRYCIYCRADCYADDPEHADDCPQSTGVYPVTEENLKPVCPHGRSHQAQRHHPRRVP